MIADATGTVIGMNVTNCTEVIVNKKEREKQNKMESSSKWCIVNVYVYLQLDVIGVILVQM